MDGSVTALVVRAGTGYLHDEWLERHKASLGELPVVVVDEPWCPPVTTDYCLVASSTGFWDTDNDSVEGLLSYAWDGSDVVYANIAYREHDYFTGTMIAQEFCPERTMVEDWIPPAFLIKTSLLQERHEDLWGMFRSIARTARFKACPHANFVETGYPRLVRVKKDAGQELEATFYCQATPATTYLRCLLPGRVLPALTLPDITWIESETDFTLPTHRGKTAVLQFAGDKSWAMGMLALQEKGVRVLIETDDNYRVNADLIQKNAGWGNKIGDERHTLQGHDWCVRHADGVIVTTEALARTYRKINPNVWVCPNQVDPADWMELERPDRPFTVGWFASRSHLADAKLVHRAFAWAAEQPGVVVKTMGLEPTWARFRPLEHIQWATDLAVYRRAMYDLDVGFAPVSPSAWAICRSDVKALEMTMGNALSILSDEPPYEWWRDKPVLMCKTAKDFYHAVKWAVANQDEARAMAAEAKKIVLSERTAAANAHLWRAALNG